VKQAVMSVSDSFGSPLLLRYLVSYATVLYIAYTQRGGLAQLVTSFVESTKLINAGPG